MAPATESECQVRASPATAESIPDNGELGRRSEKSEYLGKKSEDLGLHVLPADPERWFQLERLRKIL
jgi:hypothetical protein